jgi:2-amino-4-hydroxy-6-hydroxymethyldihydropteridine diphosphokinase
MKHITFLLLGSNLGDRKSNLQIAQNSIAASVGTLLKASAIYRTAAWGKTDQPEFLNQALKIETALSPTEVLNEILEIEKNMGRIRAEKWGERIMDIDILLYDDEQLNSPSLTLPHAQLEYRRFALVPLSEIGGEVIHPVYKTKISEMLANCTDRLEVTKVME